MSIRFACEGCGQHLAADEQLKKLPVNCPACGQRVTVPETSALLSGDRDIQFRCGTCTQSLVIDVAGAGLAVQCPTCGNGVRVPQRERSYMVPVPDWVEVSPSYLPTAALATRVFYKYWRGQIDQGHFPPLAGQIRYIFEYLYSAIDDFRGDGNIEHLLACFDRIRPGLCHYREGEGKGEAMDIRCLPCRGRLR